ncbi:hypothetical protein ACVXG7_12455 [Enterobacter hormaechei]
MMGPLLGVIRPLSASKCRSWCWRRLNRGTVRDRCGAVPDRRDPLRA